MPSLVGSEMCIRDRILIYDTGAVNCSCSRSSFRHRPFFPPHAPGYPRLPRRVCHRVELSWKLSCAQNGSVLDETRRTRVHPQNIQTGIINDVIHDTGVANTLLQHRGTFTARTSDHPEIAKASLACCRSLKLWCTPKGLVLGEIRRILVHPQNNQTGFVSEPK